MDMTQFSKESRLKKLLKHMDEELEFIPEMLAHISSKQNDYKNYCKKQHDTVLRTAISDLFALFNSKEKFPKKDIPRFCKLIKKAIFENGITGFHNQAEQEFYLKYLATEEEKEDEELNF